MEGEDKREARVFNVETSFQRLARRPGGIPRDKALVKASSKVEDSKPGFDEWINGTLQKLAGVIAAAKAGKAGPDWVETACTHSSHIRDVGTTMGFELSTFIAGSLCEVFDAIAEGAECNMDTISCHLDALFLARQPRYRNVKPEQVPELTKGLRRLADQIGTAQS